MYWLMFENPKNNFQNVILELKDLKGMIVSEYGLINILRNKFGLKVKLNDKMKYVGWEKFDYSLEHGMEINRYNEIVRVCVPECPKKLFLRMDEYVPCSLRNDVPFHADQMEIIENAKKFGSISITHPIDTTGMAIYKKQEKEEVFTTPKRMTTPQTICEKQDTDWDDDKSHTIAELISRIEMIEEKINMILKDSEDKVPDFKEVDLTPIKAISVIDQLGKILKLKGYFTVADFLELSEYKNWIVDSHKYIGWGELRYEIVKSRNNPCGINFYRIVFKDDPRPIFINEYPKKYICDIKMKSEADALKIVEEMRKQIEEKGYVTAETLLNSIYGTGIIIKQKSLKLGWDEKRDIWVQYKDGDYYITTNPAKKVGGNDHE